MRALTQFAVALSIFGAGTISEAAYAQSGQAAIGAEVRDPSGGLVGTIKSVDGSFFVVKTDKHEARLPSSSFTPDKGTFLFGMNRNQLNAEIEKAIEAANATLVVGANVHGSKGALVGTISAIEEQFVTLKLTSGKLVKIPRSGIAASAEGAVIGATAAEVQAAVE